MRTYKYTDATNRVVHVIDEDGVSRGSCLASVLEPEIVIEPADLPNHNALIDAQIATLEQANPITHRAMREFMLGTLAAFKQDPSVNPATARVARIEAEAAALRAQRK